MFTGARRTGGPVDGDVQFVDAGQTAGEVAGEQPAQSRRHRRADDDGRPGEPGVVVEVEQGAHVVDGAGRGHDVDPAANQFAGRIGVRAATGEDDDRRLDVRADQPVALLGDPPQPVGHDATADEADGHGRRSHRSGRSIGCQPPCCGGVPPRPRTRRAPATMPAIEIATKARRNSFTADNVSG